MPCGKKYKSRLFTVKKSKSKKGWGGVKMNPKA